MASWNTIESDPGVFTNLVEAFGAKGLEFAELFSLDDTEFERLSPIYGLIFLFKWTGESNTSESVSEVPNLFFAKQVISNACATQAILSVLLNISPETNPEIQLGPTLEELRAFSAELPSDMRGLAIENSEAIRNAHNSFARPEPFIVNEQKATAADDVFHFVAFLPFENHVYELDGLKPGPIHHGAINNNSSWLSVAKTAIQQRIETYAASEIKFNLLAIVRDQRQVLEEERSRLQSILATNNDPQVSAELAQVEANFANETAKRQAWEEENTRRRHNYIPFCVDLFKVLAEKSILPSLIDKANEIARNKRGQGLSPSK